MDVSGRTGHETDEKGAHPMTPAAAEDAVRASTLAASPSQAEPGLCPQAGVYGVPFTDARPTFGLRCSDVLPVNCDASWHASSCEDVIHSARQHGASTHGFTPVWYDADRLTAMAQAVTS
jgi:hypothetical protein